MKINSEPATIAPLAFFFKYQVLSCLPIAGGDDFGFLTRSVGALANRRSLNSIHHHQQTSLIQGRNSLQQITHLNKFVSFSS